MESPVITSDPDESVEMIFGKGVTQDDVDSVQVRHQVERSASRSPDVQFPDFDGEEFVNEARVKKDPSEQVDEYIKSLSED